MSSWKSGASIIGDILIQHPKSFYHYEPLAWHGIKKFVTDDDEQISNILKSLFKCQYGPSLGNDNWDKAQDTLKT